MDDQERNSSKSGGRSSGNRRKYSPPNRVDGITPRQEQAIVALMREPTIPKAALAANLAERTIYNWFNDARFMDAYRKARREAFGHAIGLTQQYAPLAVNTLAKVMADPDAPHHARVSAASALLRFGREGIELDDLAARVEMLEENLKAAAEQARAYSHAA